MHALYLLRAAAEVDRAQQRRRARSGEDRSGLKRRDAAEVGTEVGGVRRGERAPAAAVRAQRAQRAVLDVRGVLDRDPEHARAPDPPPPTCGSDGVETDGVLECGTDGVLTCGTEGVLTCGTDGVVTCGTDTCGVDGSCAGGCSCGVLTCGTDGVVGRLRP